MARALIVGCGCRGTALGSALARQGWQVRGTSRADQRLDAIAAAGIEPALADPDRVGTVLELIDDVTVLVWALASARGPRAEALHGSRLERILERIVDTPVRGFVYEAAGSVGEGVLAEGSRLVLGAHERWRIPVAVVRADPADHEGWRAAMAAAVQTVLRPA